MGALENNISPQYLKAPTYNYFVDIGGAIGFYPKKILSWILNKNQ